MLEGIEWFLGAGVVEVAEVAGLVLLSRWIQTWIWVFLLVAAWPKGDLAAWHVGIQIRVKKRRVREGFAVQQTSVAKEVVAERLACVALLCKRRLCVECVCAEVRLVVRVGGVLLDPVAKQCRIHAPSAGQGGSRSACCQVSATAADSRGGVEGGWRCGCVGGWRTLLLLLLAVGMWVVGGALLFTGVRGVGRGPRWLLRGLAVVSVL